jgi:hypothetical protein
MVHFSRKLSRLHYKYARTPRRLKFIDEFFLSPAAGLRLLEAMTHAGTWRAHGCRERWRAEDDSERQRSTAVAGL